jgi:uncharacterized protein
MRGTEVKEKYDMAAMLRRAEQLGNSFTIFGGEPLLIPIADLEKFWEFGLKKFGQNGIQTNGILISEKHFELFRKYKVHVGFSIDGPGELNKPRGDSRRSISNLYRCLSEGIPCSLITTLHRYNCNSDLIIWFSELDDRGLKSLNLHFLENDNANDLVLTQQEQIEFMGWLYEATQRFKQLRCDMFTDMIKRRYTGAGGVCVWNGCDPYNTVAVQGIGIHGELHNCGREAKEGVDWLKADSVYPMRDIALCSTPYEDGGCKGCQYWYACRGFCPGTAINGDWRNRTEHCETIMKMFEWVSTKGNVQVTVKSNDGNHCRSCR